LGAHPFVRASLKTALQAKRQKKLMFSGLKRSKPCRKGAQERA